MRPHEVVRTARYSGFTDDLASIAGYERIDRAVLQRRLLLALFALVESDAHAVSHFRGIEDGG